MYVFVFGRNGQSWYFGMGWQLCWLLSASNLPMTENSIPEGSNHQQHHCENLRSCIIHVHCRDKFLLLKKSGFGGLVVSTLASGTQDRGFAPDRSHRIFSVEKILSKPSFGGEVKHLSHVPALGHVKGPSCFVSYEFTSKITYSSFLR
jgi:hypothetical protein